MSSAQQMWAWAALVVGVWCGNSAEAVGPRFRSPIVSLKTSGRSAPIDADIKDAKSLYLIVRDGEDGFSCDWADWAEPRLVGPAGELKLTDLKWKRARADWGEARINANAQGAALKIDGQAVPYGIGTHANSVIEYDLPEGYERFRAVGGLDDGGAGQNGGSVQFLVFVDKPPTAFLTANHAVGNLDPDASVAALDVADGLEATLFAAEPLLLSPSDIDVDHLGRVWVCEVVNYRHRNGERPEGDRILILEDTDEDGVADKQTVFYQGRDVDTALGICVLPAVSGPETRVVISVAPNVFTLIDTDGDLKADKKEILFTKVGDPQHDHSTHAFIFGPDGKWYWNVGNTGHRVHDAAGNPIIDKFGHAVSDHGQPYRQGMAFRCNLDGSDFEVLGHNFRNNYELTVDSFGTVWQSDNDDDGNRGVRINYVMEYGNFGYVDELTGAGWQTPRTNLETEIPLRHWHLNDPGVVPNLIQTGGGSPTGICLYEGDLLPPAFRNQVIHCDAGPNVVRAYPAVTDGAGYKAEMAPILTGTRDNWFRPSDVTVAPDGSLIVADWYDPGVGGHRMGDVDKGRLFRVAPAGARYKRPKWNLTSVDGAIEALKSPNLVARSLGWRALAAMGPKAEAGLVKLFGDKNPRYRARALWLLSRLPETGTKHLDTALKDADSDLRITALRAYRQKVKDITPVVAALLKDKSPAVRRECALALRGSQSAAMPGQWAALASQHDGQDRWYLEALGIAAIDRWDDCLAAWLKQVGSQWNTPAGRDIVWRSRASQTPEYLLKIIGDPDRDAAELPRYFRALDFLAGEARAKVATQLAFSPVAGDSTRQGLILNEALNRLPAIDLSNRPDQQAALAKVLDQSVGTAQFVALVAKFGLTDRGADLAKLALTKPEDQAGVEAARLLLKQGQEGVLAAALQEPESAIAAAKVLGNSGDGKALPILLAIIKPSAAASADELLPLQQEAVRGVARSKAGCEQLIALAKSGELPETLKPVASFAVHSSGFADLREAATEVFPLPPSRNDQPLPPVAELLAMRGDAARGKAVFAGVGTCAKCHVVLGEGKEVGPNLSEIGSKLSRDAMFESILYPSAGISHNYETFVVTMNDGTTLQGLLTSQTPEEVAIKDINSLIRRIPRAEIDELKKSTVSIMPADLQKTMTVDELVDVVEYMQTLKKK